MIVFNNKATDLVIAGSELYKKHGSRAVICRKRFGLPAVRMANAVISQSFDWASVKGVQACLKHEIRNITWRETLFCVPLNKNKISQSGLYGGFVDRWEEHLLVDSLILSVVAYRVQLDEHHSNLSSIVFNNLLIGFEWICHVIARKGYLSEDEPYSEPDPEHPVFVLFDAAKISQWIK